MSQTRMLLMLALTNTPSHTTSCGSISSTPTARGASLLLVLSDAGTVSVRPTLGVALSGTAHLPDYHKPGVEAEAVAMT
jgi:hypothetical protein